MPVYQWQGRGRNNAATKGEMEASNEQEVRTRLQRQGITPDKVKKKPKDLFENVSFSSPR